MRLRGSHVTHGMKERIQQKAYYNAHDHLEQHDREQTPHGLLVGKKHRHHLVRSREHNGNERAHGHDAAREERGSHGRESALRNGAEK